MAKLARRKSKGIGALVSATMFITIMLLSFGLIVWNGQIYNDFLNNVNSKENAFSSQASEILSITGFKFNKNKMNLTIVNSGPDYVRIVRIWILNLTASPAWHQSFPVNIYLNPSKSVTGVGQIFGTIYSSMLYTVKLVTERGSIFSATNFIETAVLGMAQGVGWITIDWYSYKFTSTTYPNTAQPAWNFSKSRIGGLIQLQLDVVNHWDKDLTLLQYTYLRMDKSATSGTTKTYYLMDPYSTIAQPTCYDQVHNPIVLHPNSNGDFPTGGPKVTLLFLGASPTSGCKSQSSVVTDQFSVFLVIYYQYNVGSTTYTLAQTIPFEATNISP